MEDKSLYHHGVPGMHWGVRRQSSNMSSKSSSSKLDKVLFKKSGRAHIDKMVNEKGYSRKKARLIEAGKNALITAGILTASYLVGKAIKSGYSKSGKAKAEKAMETIGPTVVDKFGNIVTDASTLARIGAA